MWLSIYMCAESAKIAISKTNRFVINLSKNFSPGIREELIELALLWEKTMHLKFQILFAARNKVTLRGQMRKRRVRCIYERTCIYEATRGIYIVADLKAIVVTTPAIWLV